jgi:hypothetical protein
VVVAALICGTIGGIAMLPMGLVLQQPVIWPLTFVAAAIFATGGAVGVGSIILGSGLLPVIIASLVATIFATIFVLTVAIPTVMRVGGWVRTYHRVYLLGAGKGVIGLAASWAAWHFGRSRSGISRRGLIGRILLVVRLVVLAVVVEAAIIYAFFLIRTVSYVTTDDVRVRKEPDPK